MTTNEEVHDDQRIEGVGVPFFLHSELAVRREMVSAAFRVYKAYEFPTPCDAWSLRDLLGVSGKVSSSGRCSGRHN